MFGRHVLSKPEIVQEFHSFKDMFKEIMNSKTNSSVEKLTINNVLKFMRANDMCSINPNLSTLYHIFLTLPISSTGAERSFIRLKLIKLYLRSTMTEERLSGLGLLSIERQFATEFDYDTITDYFAKMKPRRKKLCRTVRVQRRYFLKQLHISSFKVLILNAQ